MLGVIEEHYIECITPCEKLVVLHIRFTLYICKVSSAQCTMHIEESRVYNVECRGHAVHNIQCRVYTVQFIEYIVDCRLYIIIISRKKGLHFTAPFQSLSCNVRQSCVCLSVPLQKPCFPVHSVKNIEEMDIQNISYCQDPALDNTTFLLSFTKALILNHLIPQNAF